MRVFAAASVLVLAASSAGRLAAQTGAPADAPAPTLNVQSNLILVPTAVELKHDQVLYGLRASQFVLEDNGVPQTVHLDETADAQGLSLVVLVQCSRSAVVEFARLRGLVTMVDALAGGAPHEIALVTYGKEPTLLGDFSPDIDAFATAAAALQPCDESDVDTLDAVAYANSLVEARSPANRHAILLISETRDHGSHTKPEHLIAALGRSNTVVDSVAFSPAKTEFLEDLRHGGGSGPIGLLFAAVNALKHNVPKELSALSGGEYLNFTSQKGFDRDLGHLSNRIHNYYLLSFQPQAAASQTGPSPGTPAPPLAPGLHALTVRVPDYPEAILRHRESYWFGPSPAAANAADEPAAAQPSSTSPESNR